MQKVRGTAGKGGRVRLDARRSANTNHSYCGTMWTGLDDYTLDSSATLWFPLVSIRKQGGSMCVQATLTLLTVASWLLGRHGDALLRVGGTV